MPLKNVDIFFDSNPNPMWIFDSESLRILDVNKAALSLYGYAKDEMLSLTIKDLRPEEDIPRLLESLQQQVETFDDTGIWRHVTKHGEILFVQILSHPIRVAGKRCELIVAKNVTGQVAAESRYREGQRILDLLTKQLPGTFFVLDREGRMLRWNDYTEEISGYSGHEIAEMHALDFFGPEDRSLISDAITKVLEEGYAEIKGKIRSREGRYIPLLIKANRVELKGKERILGIGIDISNLAEAQKEARSHQELLQAIIDQSHSVIYIKDEEGRFKFVNKPFLSTFGLEREEVIGSKDVEVLDEKDVSMMHESDELVRETGEPVEIEEQVHVGGELRTYLSMKVMLKGIDKYENCIFGLSTDITERKRTERQLQESLVEKETLLTEIHHRVKNNLAVVNGIMELQAMESENEEVKSKLKDSGSRIKSIAITHEILYQEQYFSKIDFGENVRKPAQNIADTFDFSKIWFLMPAPSI